MKKIITWFKQRTCNKIAIIANLAACASNLYYDCYLVAFMWFLLAVSWIIIDGYQRILKTVCELSWKNIKDSRQYILGYSIERTKTLYYLCLYRKEKLVADFCKGKWNLKDTDEYLERLRNAEDSIEAISELLHKKIKEQQENDGKDNKTETEGAE